MVNYINRRYTLEGAEDAELHLLHGERPHPFASALCNCISLTLPNALFIFRRHVQFAAHRFT